MIHKVNQSTNANPTTSQDVYRTVARRLAGLRLNLVRLVRLSSYDKR